jgi:hypothetical protein
MRKQQVKKIRQLYNRDYRKSAEGQIDYLRTILKPFPYRFFWLWIVFARFYFTQEHIDKIKEVRNNFYDEIKRNAKQPASAK